MASLSPLIEEVIKSGNNAELTVFGTSMEPFLLHGVSRVRLSKVENLTNGDVVLYRRDSGAYVLHRIVAIKNGFYTMCGDNQCVLEHGIRRDQILAVMIAFSRDGSEWNDSSEIAYKTYRVLWMRSRFARRVFRGVKWRIDRVLRKI